MQERVLDVGGLPVPLLDTGPAGAPAVALLHGFPQTRRAWDRVVPGLAGAGLRVLAPTQRGYAPGAPQGVDAYAMPALVGDVVGLLDAVGIDRAHVVGHDWGGAVAWQVAARHPDRIRTASVLTTPHPVALGRALRHDRPSQLRFSYAALLRLPGSHRALAAGGGWLLRRWMDLVGLPDGSDLLTDPDRLRTACHWYRAASGAALRDLPDVAVPSLLISGRQDPVFTRATARASARWCAGPHTHREVADGGHWLPETHPDLVVEAVLDRIGVV